MKKVSWDKNSFYMDGKAEFLISGEFHYFRIPKPDWRRRLELLKEAGGNFVATYIPWILHEPVEGDIRFGDTPERDLEAFLQLCAELELSVICRPGPYQYSEMRYDGLPGWLCDNYPEIHAQDVNGKTFRSASVSYLHRIFLEKVRKWYDAVCPIIAKYTVSKAGPVAFVQYDNEVMGIHIWYSGLDYNREAMGIGIKEGRYLEFLEEMYGCIESLNKAYSTRYKNFSDVEPIVCPKTIGERRVVKDYQEFYFTSIAKYGEILVKWMRELGIDCDIVHNSPNPTTNSAFLKTNKLLGSSFLLGTDHYYNLSPDWDQNNPTPQHMTKVIYSNEMLRLMGFPPTVFELPAGSASDWPPITSEDLSCYYYANVAFGMKGLNYYVFTGGPNPKGVGQFGDIYDYGAGIGADGSIRTIYEIQKSFGRFLKENAWLANAEKMYDFFIGIDWEHSQSERYFNESVEYEFSSHEAWSFMRKGMLVSALNASYSPGFIDLYCDEAVLSLEKPIVVPASVNMPRSVQERIVRFIEGGGKIILAPVIPYMDENFNCCTVLKDFLGGVEVKRFIGNFPRVNIGNIENVFVNGKLFTSQNSPQNAIRIAEDHYSGTELGWKKSFEGGGCVIWLGMQWTNSMHTHKDMFRFLMSELGCTNKVKCDNPNVWTSLRRYGEKGMLFVMNFFSSPMNARIEVEINQKTYLEEIEGALLPMEVKTYPVDFGKIRRMEV